MPVLVDPIRRYDHLTLSIKDWCHMAVDGTFEELHAFAATLGIPRHRFQGDHYDLPPWVRERAVAPRRGGGLARRSCCSPLPLGGRDLPRGGDPRRRHHRGRSSQRCVRARRRRRPPDRGRSRGTGRDTWRSTRRLRGRSLPRGRGRRGPAGGQLRAELATRADEARSTTAARLTLLSAPSRGSPDPGWLTLFPANREFCQPPLVRRWDDAASGPVGTTGRAPANVAAATMEVAVARSAGGADAS